MAVQASSHVRNPMEMVEIALDRNDLFAVLSFLNSTASYRFTGIYLFEKDIVKSLLMFDRENPDLRVGANVLWKDSYCSLVEEDGESYEIRNSLTDPRLIGHPKRNTIHSYCAVLLRTPTGDPLGTICHFNLQQIDKSASKALEDLSAIRPLVERFLCSENTSGNPKSAGRTAENTHGIALMTSRVWKVMTVDDNDTQRKMMATLLRRAGFEATAVSTGKEAISRSITDSPDVMLLDINLPDMNGYEVCSRIKADRKTASIPVIFYTGQMDAAAKNKAELVGGSSFLTYPVKLSHLKTVIESIVAQVKVPKAGKANTTKPTDRFNLSID